MTVQTQTIQIGHCALQCSVWVIHTY